jgi:CheY-like chemotaxis protein
MDEPMPTVLVVDDEEWNRDILREYLERADYSIREAENGAQALAILKERAESIDVVLLDRMMPGMDGIEVLRRLSRTRGFRDPPVILQTARADPTSVAEGLDAGAFYYLTKPFEPQVMLSIVRAAVYDRRQAQDLRREMTDRFNLVSLANQATFRLRTVAEARGLAAALARACPKPETAAVGLVELMVNGIEHGNLGISYDDKTRLCLDGAWPEEVERRLTLPENRDKHIEVGFARESDRIAFTIRDQGPGFDWERYLEIDPRRILHCHGRGIALAKANAFSDLRYQAPGNVVVATIALAER